MRYGRFGKLGTRPGQRDALAALLLRDVETLREVGCELYIVQTAAAHPDAVWVTEVWTTREAHRASLQRPSVKQAIAEAMPLLCGEFESSEFDVVGGLGLPETAP